CISAMQKKTVVPRGTPPNRENCVGISALAQADGADWGRLAAKEVRKPDRSVWSSTRCPACNSGYLSWGASCQYACFSRYRFVSALKEPDALRPSAPEARVSRL